MREEIVLIVDAENRECGSAPRSRVRAERLWHRATYIFVLDSSGQLYVQKRTMTKDIYPGYWSIAFGGHVLSGESYDAAARREILEEVGLDAPARQIGGFQKRTADERENVKVYGVIADREPALFADEIAQGQFMTLAELNQMIPRFDFLPETPDLLKILIAHTSRRQS